MYVRCLQPKCTSPYFSVSVMRCVSKFICSRSFSRKKASTSKEITHSTSHVPHTDVYHSKCLYLPLYSCQLPHLLHVTPDPCSQENISPSPSGPQLVLVPDRGRKITLIPSLFYLCCPLTLHKTFSLNPLEPTPSTSTAVSA